MNSEAEPCPSCKATAGCDCDPYDVLGAIVEQHPIPSPRGYPSSAPAVPGRLAEAEARVIRWARALLDTTHELVRSAGQDAREVWDDLERALRYYDRLAPQPEPSASPMPTEDAGTLPSQHLPAEEERDPDVRPTWDERGLPLCDDVCPNFDGKRCKATGFRPDRFCEPELIRLSALAGQVEGMEQKSVPSPSASPVSAAPTWQNDVRCLDCDFLCPPPPDGGHGGCLCDCHRAAVPTKKEEPSHG